MFKITIEEEKTARKIVDGRWQTLEETKDGDRKNGYAPAREENVTTKREIYMQEVEELDLVAVISAVNRMNVTVN